MRRPTFYLVGAGVSRTVANSIGAPFSLHPTITTARGTVAKLISRDCCPYLEEPDYPHAAAAVTSGEHWQYLGTHWAPPSMNHRQPLYAWSSPTADLSLRKLGFPPEIGPTPTTSILPFSSPIATQTQVRTRPVQIILISLSSHIIPTGCNTTTMRILMRYTRPRQAFHRLATEAGSGTLRSQIVLW